MGVTFILMLPALSVPAAKVLESFARKLIDCNNGGRVYVVWPQVPAPSQPNPWSKSFLFFHPTKSRVDRFWLRGAKPLTAAAAAAAAREWEEIGPFENTSNTFAELLLLLLHHHQQQLEKKNRWILFSIKTFCQKKTIDYSLKKLCKVELPALGWCWLP